MIAFLSTRRVRVAVMLLLCLTMAAACNRKARRRDRQRKVEVPPVDTSWAPRAVAAVNGVPADSLRVAIAALLAAARPKLLDAPAWDRTKDLYEQFENSPLWLDAQGLRGKRTAALLDAVAAADSDALALSAFPLRALGDALAAVRGTAAPTAQQLANADVLLTSVYAALGGAYLSGQVDPRKMTQDWHIDTREKDIDSVLTAVISSQDLTKGIVQLRPQETDYDSLRVQLQRFRTLVKAGGWGTVPKGKPLHPGDVDTPERLNALYDRLQKEGLLASDAPRPAAPPPDTVAVDTTRLDSARLDSARLDSATRARAAVPNGLLYDTVLAGGVARFQMTHGISVDSLLGPETIEALNVPADYRLGQIAANLERYRWLPRTLGSRYILVNVPAFRLEGYDSGEVAIEMKVIVGADYTDKNTPVFSDQMETVVFRPYWNVTPDIQHKELEPKVAADPGYMDRNDYEYWKDGGVTRIRQKPGPKNSLGLVKFLFPNSFNIYLHDTPDDQLFAKDVRAFSHGCIRLEKPAELAQWALGWSADSVERAMNEEPNNKSVRLPSKIPVFIVYFTAFSGDEGLRFGNDLYSRDKELVDAVSASAMPSEEAINAASALREIARQIALAPSIPPASRRAA
jgi:murein L,D-transpeptidase YcbB/YkuD